MAPNIYEPLDLPHETRILTILPGNDDEEIVCKLSNMKFASCEAYEALSYCWGRSVARELDLDTEVLIRDVSQPIPDLHSEPAILQEFLELHMRPVAVKDLLGTESEYIYIRFGGPLPSGKIVCNDSELTVGGELFRALRYIRDDETPRRIWIDAVCINQDDLQERAELVKIMGQIYQNASMVRVWLGDTTGEEHKLGQTLRGLQEIFTDCGESSDDKETLAQRKKLFQSHPEWKSINWYALADFFDRAWFERIWVVQELANAKNAIIQIGRYLIHWDAMEKVIALLRHYGGNDHIPHTSGFERANEVRRLRETRQSGRLVSEAELPSKLNALREFKSTMPMDKIYGLLGLMDPAISIEVNYAKSAESLFTDLAVRYLQHGCMDMLYYCSELHQPTSLSLPSWVPDWTRQRWTRPFLMRGLPSHATGDTRFQPSVDPDGQTIRLRGRLLDKILLVNDQAEIPVDQFEPYNRTVHGDAQAHRRYTVKVEQRRMRDALEQSVRLAWPNSDRFTWEKYENMWRTFICNRLIDDSIPTEDYGYAWELFMGMLRWQTANKDEAKSGCYYEEVVPVDTTGLREQQKQTKGEAGLLRYGGAHTRWCYNRRFFISSAERYGWAVDGTKAGDIVAVLYGCPYPFLLRESSDGSYKILGDCYIHGLMDGEALEGAFEEKEFMIS
ncbi:uncharacterized protein N0V89_007972 [Didymosphaeria variabile]|uniref:Heterokaryon incompatibility domain-containing protein n=1 Tax=Didymosphaeria variabile TaxID=1932322 RepID=A0A9W9C8F3_9PLEO|nr:uncharacterized protein N0V89_007972 [Didymosphaeria variabile]KAJ4349358.1 hypothetical protein N0V89_007972 [Didymosphaeria variabile]